MGRPEGEGAGHGAGTALVGEVEVAVSGSREQLTVHPHGQGSVCAEVSQELVGRGEAFVARPPGGDPVTGVGLGVIWEHEAIRIEGMWEGGRHAGRHGALVEGVQRVGGVHQGVV